MYIRLVAQSYLTTTHTPMQGDCSACCSPRNLPQIRKYLFPCLRVSLCCLTGTTWSCGKGFAGQNLSGPEKADQSLEGR